jgi:hypothetical protein
MIVSGTKCALRLNIVFLAVAHSPFYKGVGIVFFDIARAGHARSECVVRISYCAADGPCPGLRVEDKHR